MGQWGQGLLGQGLQELQELLGQEQQELSGLPLPTGSTLQRCLASWSPLP